MRYLLVLAVSIMYPKSVLRLRKRLLVLKRISAELVAIEIFKYKAELVCPRCSSANIDKKFKHMGEYFCRHCHYYWRTE